MIKEDVTKLPRWARFLIEKLTKDLVYWKKKALAAASEGGETDTRIYMSDRSGPSGLPPGCTISFKLEHGEAHVQVEDGMLYLYFPGSYPVILPDTGNTFYVGIRKEWP
jgi:hypothetical protein